MPDDRLLKAKVKSTLDIYLSGADDMPSLRYDIMRKVRGGKPVKKKLTVGLVLLIALSLAVVTALAAIALTIHASMQKAVELSDEGVFGRWRLEDKRKLIAMMEEFGIALDAEKIALLKANAGGEEELDMLAEEIINLVYGERIRSHFPEGVYQPEEYYPPDYFVLFEDLWLRNNPEATEEEILAAYEQWEGEALEAPEPWTFEMQAAHEREMYELGEARRTSIRTEEEMLRLADGLLSEVLSFSKKERQKTTVGIRFIEIKNIQLWEITLTIRAEDAKPHTIEALTEWMNASFHEEDAAYTAVTYCLPNGDYVGWNMDHILVHSLIPISEYPGEFESGPEYRRFIGGTVEEKAAFSAKWKPIVDQWLAAHPDTAEWLKQDTGIYPAILCTRHLYGVPSEKAIPEEAAIEIAKKAYLDSGVTGISFVSYAPGKVTRVTEDMIRERCSIHSFYDITDEGSPLWKIYFSYKEYENPLEEDHKDGYFVIIDAFSGQVLNGYTRSGLEPGNGRYEEGPRGSFQIAEEYF